MLTTPAARVLRRLHDSSVAVRVAGRAAASLHCDARSPRTTACVTDSEPIARRRTASSAQNGRRARPTACAGCRRYHVALARRSSRRSSHEHAHNAAAPRRAANSRTIRLQNPMLWAIGLSSRWSLKRDESWPHSGEGSASAASAIDAALTARSLLRKSCCDSKRRPSRRPQSHAQALSAWTNKTALSQPVDPPLRVGRPPSCRVVPGVSPALAKPAQNRGRSQ